MADHASRANFMAGSAAAYATIAVVLAPAKAAQFEFKCGTTLSWNQPSSPRAVQMWAAIERESGGRVHTQFFPDSLLGGDAAMLSQLRLGVLQFQLLSAGTLSAVVPSADISRLGFVYKDSAEALRVMDGPLGAYVREETAAKGMRALHTIWDSTMHQIGSGPRPIRTPDDLHGYKIKILGKISFDFFKELGAVPVQFPYAELYTNLKTKLVDGEDVPLAAIDASRLYEVNKYISMTDHSWGGYWMIANAEAWRSLPPDLQNIIERNNTKYSMLERRDSTVLDVSLVDKLTRLGLTFNRVDQSQFRRRLGTYFEDWAKVFGPTAWGLLQSSLGRKLA